MCKIINWKKSRMSWSKEFLQKSIFLAELVNNIYSHYSGNERDDCQSLLSSFHHGTSPDSRARYSIQGSVVRRGPLFKIYFTLCVVLCDWRFYKGSSLALDDPAPPGHLEGGSTLIYGSRNSSPGLTRISLPSSSYVRNAHSAEVPRESICFVPVYCIMSKSPSAGLQTYWWQDLQARLTFTFS